MTPSSNSSGFPRGLEVLLKKAAIDPDFRRLLIERRESAADEIGLALDPGEQAMLRAMPAEQLRAIIDRTEVPDEGRRAFLGKAAAAMLAALGGMGSVVAGGAELPEGGSRPVLPPGGARPDGTFGDRPDLPPRPQPEGDKPVSSSQRPVWDRPVKPVEKFEDGDGTCKLTCELAGLPPSAKTAAKISLRVQIANPTDKIVPLLALHNRPGVSAGTGVGLEFCRTGAGGGAGILDLKPAGEPKSGAEPKPQATPAPDDEQIPIPQKPPFTNRPDDLQAVLPVPQIAANGRITVPLTVRLPEEPGSYQVRAFIRSWAYADPSAAAALDVKTVRERFIRRAIGESKTLELTPATGGPTTDPNNAPPRPDRIPAAGGARPDKIPMLGGSRADVPNRPVGGVGGVLMP